MSWREELIRARDEGYVLDWLSASDEPLTLTACLVRADEPADVRLVHGDPPVESVADVFASAAWHERETAEMFGLEFLGSPPQPLLLAAGDPPRLRKQAPLSQRVDQPWPGAVDPAKPRRRQDPPGTPWL